MIILILSSCGTSRHVQMQVAEHVHKDTIYLSNIQYDSIYIYQELLQKDTILLSPSKGETEGVYIKDRSIEYRYKLLQDTIYKVQIDSIPYEVRITEVKEVKHIPPWIKPLALMGFITILVLIIYLFTKYKRF